MSIRQFHLSNYDMFSLLECIGIKNICVHLGIFTATCNLSKVSDLTNQIMIPESGIMDEQHQNKVYRLLAFFLPWAMLGSFCLPIFYIASLHLVAICRLLPHFHIGFKPMGTEYESMYYSVWDNKNHIIIRAHPSLLKPQVWC